MWSSLSLETVWATTFWTLLIVIGAGLVARFPEPAGAGWSSVGLRWWRFAWSVLIALLVILFFGYVFSCTGHFTRRLCWWSVLALGAAILVWRPGPVRRNRGGFVLLAAWLIALLLLWPQRGAWLAGGWDPGIYANEGAAVARGGTFQPAPVPFYQQLGPDLLRTLTVDQRTYRELFPGVPVDLERGAYQLQFPRLTSVWFAVQHAVGGAASGWPGPLLLAALAWLVWAAVAQAGATARTAGWTGAAVLLLQPVFLYHTHTPSSELLELALVGGLCLAPWWGASFRLRGALTALLLLAGAANRTSFALFGALYLVLLALVDASRVDRPRVILERIGLIAALAAGAAAHHVFTPVAVLKLAHVLPGLERTAAWLAGLALAVDVGAGWWHGARRHPVLIERVLRWSLGLGVLLLLGLVLSPGSESAARAPLVSFYLFAPLVALALLGLGLTAWRGADARRLLPLVWCLAATLVVVRHPHVADLYPWATKRYLAFAVPLLALGGAALIQAAADARLGVRVLPVLAVGTALAFQFPRSVDAWRATSYDGLPAVLQQVATQVKSADGVVADHFLWATPLALAWGCPVVNGEALIRDPESEATRAVWRRLTDLAASGQRICLLTTTDVGPAKWGPAAPTLTLTWDSGPVSYRETFHHRSARGFSTVQKTRIFRIYELTPGSARDG